MNQPSRRQLTNKLTVYMFRQSSGSETYPQNRRRSYPSYSVSLFKIQYDLVAIQSENEKGVDASRYNTQESNHLTQFHNK